MRTFFSGVVIAAAVFLASPASALFQSGQGLLKDIEKDPRNPISHKEAAKLYARTGAHSEAIRHYQEAIALAPGDTDSRLHLAELFGWTGDLDRAIVTYEDLLKLEPTNLQARLGLAQVLRWSHRYAEAEQHLKMVLEADPDNRDAIKGMARTYALAGDFKKSLAFLDRGVSLYPRDAELHTEKGVVLAWSGNLNQGIVFLQKAAALDPSSASTYRSLGDAYTWRREFSYAIESYRRALELEPNSADTELDLARAYKNLGSKSQAEDVVKHVLRQDPANHQAVELLQQIRRDAKVSGTWMIEEFGEPVVYLGTVLMLIWLFYRRRRLIFRKTPLYRYLYRVILPSLFVLFLAAYGVRIMTHAGLYYEIAEIVLLVTVALFSFLLSWDRRMTPAPLTDSVLVVGAHPDDIEIAAAGSLLRLKQEGSRIFGLVLSQGENGTTAAKGVRQREAESAATSLGFDSLSVLDFPDTQLRQHITQIKEVIEKKIKELKIRMVVTHSPQETHGDHSAVFEAAKEASRTCSLICFESISAPKEFVPNYFVDITPYLPDKLRIIGHHKTQAEKLYMDPEVVKGRAAHRGLQAGVPFAEAFWVYRWVR